MIQKKDKLIIRDGKFFRGMEEVPIECGNKEQIDLLKEMEFLINSYENEGLDIYPDYEVTVTASVVVECICGGKIYIETETDEENIDCFVGISRKCRGCGMDYELFKEGRTLMVKQVKKTDSEEESTEKKDIKQNNNSASLFL
jgi:hypothetical protein